MLKVWEALSGRSKSAVCLYISQLSMLGLFKHKAGFYVSAKYVIRSFEKLMFIFCEFLSKSLEKCCLKSILASKSETNIK